MLDASTVFYMQKLVAGPEAVGVLDIRLPIGENIAALAGALGKPISEIHVGVLDRPRHEGLIAEIRAAGAATRLLLDGDVAGGIVAASDDDGIDMCAGIGGSPEGVVTACAMKALGGFIQARLAPRRRRRTPARHRRRSRDGSRIRGRRTGAGNNTIFVATGVTDGSLVAGVRREGDHPYTESVVLRSASGTLRRIASEHLVSKWL